MKVVHEELGKNVEIDSENTKLRRLRSAYTYPEAKRAVKCLNIQSGVEYGKVYKNDKRLPSRPDKLYAGKGWVNWHEFLSIGIKRYATYEEAKVAAKALRFKSWNDYTLRYKIDPLLPSNPHQKYAGHGWISWQEFLQPVQSSPRGEHLYQTYEEGKAAALIIGFRSSADYYKRRAIDPRLPTNPNQFYAGKGWIDWIDFLRHTPRAIYMDYDEAKAATQALGIHGSKEYRRRYKEDPKLPSEPRQTYAGKGWRGWKEFLGTTRYQTYAEAKSAVERLSISSSFEYAKKYKEDPRLPSRPSLDYAENGWTTWNDFLGKASNSRRHNIYGTYADAEGAVRQLNITSFAEYKSRHKEDTRLPVNPKAVYINNGWQDWCIFFGREKIKLYATYSEAQSAVLRLGVKSREAYFECLRKREDPRLPWKPNVKYANAGWQDWRTFFGD